jgi:hypothetical protein
MRYLVLALLAALAVFAPTAQAAATKPAPVVTVLTVKKSGKDVKFDLLGDLIPAPSTCTGILTASHKLSKKKTVKWKGKLKSFAGTCDTTIHAKLPVAKYDKKVKIKFAFPGNKSIKKFSSTKSLKIAETKTGELPPGIKVPSPVVGPQNPGTWFMFKKGDSSDIGMQFTIKPDYTVPGLTRPSGLPVTCTSGNKSIPFNWSKLNFAMGAQTGVITSGDSGQYASNMHYTLTWSFTDAHNGTGHFAALGGYVFTPGQSPEGCAAAYEVTFSGGNP